MSDSETFGFLDSVDELEGDDLLLAAIEEGDDDLVVEILRDAGDELKYNPEYFDRIVAADLVKAFKSYPRELSDLDVLHIWNIASWNKSWGVLTEMVRRGTIGKKLPRDAPETVIRATLALGEEAQEILVLNLADKLTSHDWHGAVFLLENMEVDPSVDTQVIMYWVSKTAPEWFIEFFLDTVPISTVMAVGEIGARSAYVQVLKNRGYDLDSYFASEGVPVHIAAELYNPEYAETVMIRALKDGDSDLVEFLEAKGVRVAQPELFR